MSVTLVNEVEPRTQYTASGSQVDFPVSWPARRAQDVLVTFDDGVIPGIAYSLIGIDEDAGFLVRFDEAPPADTRVTVVRMAPFERQTNYGQQKAFTAQAVNSEFADHVMLMLQLLEQLARCLQVSPSDDTNVSLIIPPADARANGFLGFGPTGEPIVVTSVMPSTITVTSFWQAMLALATAATSRAALGLGTAATVDVGSAPNQVPLNSLLAGVVVGGSMMSGSYSSAALYYARFMSVYPLVR